MSARLVVTIDTEPDDQWTIPPPGAPLRQLTFANTRGLARLIDCLGDLGTPGTWLTTWSVARDEPSVRVLSAAAQAGAEIGAHLHAWETPPLTEADRRAHPYIYEYEPAVRLEKLRAVTSAVEEAFGSRPLSYRAGRWGIDAVERDNLAALGYAVDTSVVPGHDFSHAKGLARGGPDFRARLDGEPPRPSREGSLWEVPVSVATLGVLGAGGLGLGARLASRLAYRRDLPARPVGGALAGAGLCRMVWLRPLLHPRADLVRAARRLMRRGPAVVNVMFHSSEAFEGASPRSRSRQDVERFYGDLKAIVATLKEEGGVAPCTLRAALDLP